MAFRRGFTLAAAAFLSLLLLAACTGAPAPAPPATPTPAVQAGFPFTVWDSSGDPVTIAGPPRRIVSLSPAQTETFFALGVGDLVVGRDRFSDFPAAAQGVPVVGDAFALDLERLASLKPDLVYVDFATPKAGIERLGLKVLYLDPPKTVDGVMERTLLLGRLVDRLPAAQALVRDMRTQVQAVEGRLRDIGLGPRVFYELDPGLFTVGPNTFIGDLLQQLKARNIASAVQGAYPQLSNEFILQQDPEVILLGDAREFGSGDETPQTVAARAGWATITAVRQGRIYPTDPDLVTRPGPRIGQGMEHLARLLYPEVFR